MEEHIFNIDQLKELCAYWQNRLRLQHWDILLSIVRKGDLAIPDSSGVCRRTISLALANIDLIDPIDFPKNQQAYDMEVVLVHELLHLHFAPIDNCKPADDLETIFLERAVDHIARALVETKREVQSCR